MAIYSNIDMLDLKKTVTLTRWHSAIWQCRIATEGEDPAVSGADQALRICIMVTFKKQSKHVHQVICWTRADHNPVQLPRVFGAENRSTSSEFYRKTKFGMPTAMLQGVVELVNIPVNVAIQCNHARDDRR